MIVPHGQQGDFTRKAHTVPARTQSAHCTRAAGYSSYVACSLISQHVAASRTMSSNGRISRQCLCLSMSGLSCGRNDKTCVATTIYTWWQALSSGQKTCDVYTDDTRMICDTIRVRKVVRHARTYNIYLIPGTRYVPAYTQIGSFLNRWDDQAPCVLRTRGG